MNTTPSYSVFLHKFLQHWSIPIWLKLTHDSFIFLFQFSFRKRYWFHSKWQIMFLQMFKVLIKLIVWKHGHQKVLNLKDFRKIYLKSNYMYWTVSIILGLHMSMKNLSQHFLSYMTFWLLIWNLASLALIDGKSWK